MDAELDGIFSSFTATWHKSLFTVEDLSTLAHHVVGLVLLITESWSRVFGSGKESVIKHV